MYHILKQVSEKWRDIGRELRIPERMLQTLQDANVPPEQCCNKMIEEWLMYSGDEPSWYSLTEALRRLNMEQEIEKIMTKWGKSYFSLPSLAKPSNQLTGSVLSGPHVKTCSQMKDEDKRKGAIADTFLSLFADVVKPQWNLLASYIISNNYDPNEESVLEQLQAWKEEKTPTYEDLYESLNQLIVNPPVTPENGRPKGRLRFLHVASNKFNLYSHVILQT